MFVEFAIDKDLVRSYVNLYQKHVMTDHASSYEQEMWVKRGGVTCTQILISLNQAMIMNVVQIVQNRKENLNTSPLL